MFKQNDTTLKSTSAASVVKGPVVRGRKNPLWFGFARRLLDCRDALNWPLQWVADRAETSHVSISRLEDGKQQPSIDLVERIACALGVPVCWLAFGQLGAEPFRGKRPSSEPVAPIPAPTPGAYRNEQRAAQVGLRLAQLRREAGLSLRDLAECAGTSHQVITNIENGRGMPKLDIAERLAVALNVAPCLLAYGIEAPPRTVRERRNRITHDGTEALPRVSMRGKPAGNRGATRAS